MKREWPKSPYPEKYRWPMVEARLQTHLRSEAWANACRALSQNADLREQDYDEPFLRLWSAESQPSIDALRSSVAPYRLMRWRPSVLDDRAIARFAKDQTLYALLPATDLVDAVCAMGTAGPNQGVGVLTVARFVMHLRLFANFDIDTLGESYLGMQITPKSDEDAELIAHKARGLCADLRKVDELKTTIQRINATGRLELNWESL